jgi:hypothetical protein
VADGVQGVEGTRAVSTDWRQSEALPFSEWETVNSMSADDCRAKALACMTKADALDDARQKAAMLKYAEWWNRLAEYHAKTGLNSSPKKPENPEHGEPPRRQF